jgi:ABC-type branched-subunit amino acid transport system permease subunit
MIQAFAEEGMLYLGLAAVFGDGTYMADVSFYREQIAAVVPEPGAATYAGVALAACAGWATIRRR